MSPFRRNFLIAIVLSISLPCTAEETEESKAAREIRALGGHAFLNPKTNRIGEINLNRNSRVTDETLELVARCGDITDLSLEATGIGNVGISKIEGLTKIEWLNLYRTKITDHATTSIATLPQLQHLPIGETAITDKGLPSLYTLKNLQYLGLRGTAVTDRGIAGIEKLKSLTGLHLGQTAVTNRSLPIISKLRKLEKLWLHDTVVTGEAVMKMMAELTNLKELHLQRTNLSIEDVKRLRKRFPSCKVLYERD